MRYSIEPRDQIHVKGYGLLALAKKWANVWAVSMDKSIVAAPMSNRCSQTASKRVNQKMAEATGDLVEKKKLQRRLKKLLQRWGSRSFDGARAHTNRDTKRKIYITKNTEVNYWLTLIIIINNIARIEHQKITYLLGNTNNQQLKFRTKNWVEVNNYANGKDDSSDQIRLKTTKVEPSLCVHTC